MVRDGDVVEREKVHNLVPFNGVHYVMGAAYLGEPQFTSWYCGVYSGAYTPEHMDTLTKVVDEAIEFTGYEGGTRLPCVFKQPSLGVIKAETIEMNINKPVTLYGGFVASTKTHGNKSGVLASVVRFSSPKELSVGDTLRIGVEIEFVVL